MGDDKVITPACSMTATERVLPRLALDFTTGVLDPRCRVARGAAEAAGLGGAVRRGAGRRAVPAADRARLHRDRRGGRGDCSAKSRERAHT